MVDSIRYHSSYGKTSLLIHTTMSKYQVFFALLAVSAAFAAPAAHTDDQTADDTAALLYRAPYPYHYGVYSPALASPYAYPAVAPAVVAAPLAHAEPLIQPVYTPTVKVLPAPATYAYQPARYGYAHGQATPTSYSYTHVSRGW